MRDNVQPIIKIQTGDAGLLLGFLCCNWQQTEHFLLPMQLEFTLNEVSIMLYCNK